MLPLNKPPFERGGLFEDLGYSLYFISSLNVIQHKIRAADRRPGHWGKDSVGALESDTKIFWDRAHFKMGNAYYFQLFAHVIEYG